MLTAFVYRAGLYSSEGTFNLKLWAAPSLRQIDLQAAAQEPFVFAQFPPTLAEDEQFRLHFVVSPATEPSVELQTWSVSAHLSLIDPHANEV